ncbi:MAG TPA: 2-dehydropantoate 2-reductase [Kofleriaceae bacterium]|nr:2-dehydropantoate 2-reductase [Kofleriaceae bacterium]
MKILIVGAGRLGSLLAASLQRAGDAVVLVTGTRAAEPAGERDIAIASHGDSFRARVRTAATIGDAERHGPYDRVVLCVRTLDLDAIEPALAEHAPALLAPGGTALSMLNGLDGDDALARWFSAERVVGAVANLAVERDAAGTLVVTTGGDLVVAPLATSAGHTAASIARWLTASGIPCRAASDLRMLRWTKLAWSCAINAVTALAQRPMGDVARNPHTRALVLGVIREVMMVAAAEGLALAPALPAVYLRAAIDAGGARSSMLQDVLSGRATEHAALNGAVCSYARRHRLSVPLNAALFALLDARTDPNVSREEIS